MVSLRVFRGILDIPVGIIYIIRQKLERKYEPLPVFNIDDLASLSLMTVPVCVSTDTCMLAIHYARDNDGILPMRTSRAGVELKKRSLWHFVQT